VSVKVQYVQYVSTIDTRRCTPQQPAHTARHYRSGLVRRAHIAASPQSAVRIAAHHVRAHEQVVCSTRVHIPALSDYAC
jgi:hypothetical protein